MTSSPSTRSPAGAAIAPRRQYTLAQPVQKTGIGLHSGHQSHVTIQPAAAQAGRYFVRVDQPTAPPIPATVAAVRQTLLSTELAAGEATVRTVEHLLAALAGLGIDNARIEIDGSELPLLDGSAQDWVTAIAAAGRQEQAAIRPPLHLPQPVTVHQGDAFVTAIPAPRLKFTYGIEFDLAAIGTQWFSWSPEPDQADVTNLSATSFATEVAPARTFGLAPQLEALRSQGLIKGGSLDNALVCDADGWVNPPLRFSNEPARHKLLDLVGDLSLLGDLPPCHILAYKASHQLHVQLARSLATVITKAEPS